MVNQVSVPSFQSSCVTNSSVLVGAVSFFPFIGPRFLAALNPGEQSSTPTSVSPSVEINRVAFLAYQIRSFVADVGSLKSMFAIRRHVSMYLVMTLSVLHGGLERDWGQPRIVAVCESSGPPRIVNRKTDQPPLRWRIATGLRRDTRATDLVFWWRWLVSLPFLFFSRILRMCLCVGVRFWAHLCWRLRFQAVTSSVVSLHGSGRFLGLWQGLW